MTFDSSKVLFSQLSQKHSTLRDAVVVVLRKGEITAEESRSMRNS